MVCSRKHWFIQILNVMKVKTLNLLLVLWKGRVHSSNCSRAFNTYRHWKFMIDNIVFSEGQLMLVHDQYRVNYSYAAQEGLMVVPKQKCRVKSQ